MVRDIRWTRLALARLDEIAAWIAEDNPVRATSFVQELRQKLQALCEHELGKPGRVYGTRELVLHRHYLAVYRVRGNEVQVPTILHTARRRD